jgi:hypothetical protein
VAGGPNTTSQVTGKRFEIVARRTLALVVESAGWVKM